MKPADPRPNRILKVCFPDGVTEEQKEQAQWALRQASIELADRIKEAKSRHQNKDRPEMDDGGNQPG